LLTAGLLLCAATEGIGQRPPATLGLRVLSAHPKDFWLEITNVSAVPIDGPVRLTVRLTRLDDNAYVWQSTSRTIAGQSLPDTDEVVLKRSSDQP
jgi:hypothetical protein